VTDGTANGKRWKIRRMGPGDAPRVVSLIHQCYAETYIKQCYDPEYIVRRNAGAACFPSWP